MPTPRFSAATHHHRPWPHTVMRLTQHTFALFALLTLTSCAGGFQVGALDDTSPADTAAPNPQTLNPGPASDQVKIIIVPHTEARLINDKGVDAKLRNRGDLGDTPGVDAFVDDANDDLTQTTLFVGADPRGEGRAFLMFDLEAIPRGAEIIAAKLVLTVAVTGDGELELAMGAAQDAWTPETLTWTTQPLIAEATLQIQATQKSSSQDAFEVVDLVQAWHSAELPNHGLVLKGLPSNPVAFRSYHTVKSGNLHNGPRLELIYRVGPQSGAPDPSRRHTRLTGPH